MMILLSPAETTDLYHIPWFLPIFLCFHFRLFSLLDIHEPIKISMPWFIPMITISRWARVFFLSFSFASLLPGRSLWLFTKCTNRLLFEPFSIYFTYFMILWCWRTKTKRMCFGWCEEASFYVTRETWLLCYTIHVSSLLISIWTFIAIHPLR